MMKITHITIRTQAYIAANLVSYLERDNSLSYPIISNNTNN
jgi:hypothetical protein